MRKTPDWREKVEFEREIPGVGACWIVARANLLGPDHTGAESIEDFDLSVFPLLPDGDADFEAEIPRTRIAAFWDSLEDEAEVGFENIREERRENARYGDGGW